MFGWLCFVWNLLVQQDLAAGTHVLARLSGTLVLTGLQANNGLASLQLFFGEFTLALISGLGAQEGTSEFRVFVALEKKKEK